MRHTKSLLSTVSITRSMPIFEVRLDSLDHRTSEQKEIAGSEMADLTTVRRPTVKVLMQNTHISKTSNFTRQQMKNTPYTRSWVTAPTAKYKPSKHLRDGSRII